MSYVILFMILIGIMAILFIVISCIATFGYNGESEISDIPQKATEKNEE